MKSTRPGLVRNPPDIIRIARPFEAVHNHNRRHMATLPLLPVAHAFQLRLRIHAKQPLLALRQRKLPLQERPRHRLQVSVLQPSVWLKFFEIFAHPPTLGETRPTAKQWHGSVGTEPTPG